MIEIRIHGRGGQGAVIASLILAKAAHEEGWQVQVFPEFGVERRGVPVTAFARLDRQPIFLRTKIYRPDHIIVLDPALTQFIDVTAGLMENGWILINTPKAPSTFEFVDRFQVATVDATEIAARHKIGTASSPIVNTTMIGAFSRITGIVSMDAVSKAILDTISGAAGAENVAAAREASDKVMVSQTLLQEAMLRMEESHGWGDI